MAWLKIGLCATIRIMSGMRDGIGLYRNIYIYICLNQFGQRAGENLPQFVLVSPELRVHSS